MQNALGATLTLQVLKFYNRQELCLGKIGDPSMVSACKSMWFQLRIGRGCYYYYYYYSYYYSYYYYYYDDDDDDADDDDDDDHCTSTYASVYRSSVGGFA